MRVHAPLSRTGIRALSLLAFALGLMVFVTRPAEAAGPACSAPASTTISLGNVAVLPGTPNGTLLGSPATVSITFDCGNVFSDHDGRRDGWQDITIQAGELAAFDITTPAPNGGIMFKTSVPGIEVELTATPNQASDGGGGPAGVPGWPVGTMCPPNRRDRYSNDPNSCSTTAETLTATFTAQLVKVGAVTPGTLQLTPVLRLTNYSYGRSNSASYYANLNIGSVAVTTPACEVVVDPTVVTLPTVSAATFNGVGSTAGQTAFQVQLNCEKSGVALDITLATSNPQTGATGVIAPTTGSGNAQDVGVQIVKADGSTPVSFGTAIHEGNTPNGTFNLPFYARYYQTGNNVTAGSVHATATYTLTYP